MKEQRPDPDALLARVKEEEARQTRGRLKVFLGAAPGVGKTYAMLQAAHERRAEGRDVLVGWVDTHGRAETEALVTGLEVLPRQTVEYHGAVLWEFDLDAALARRPALILVDELAHTNAPSSRHPKRWQDVLELLDAGISVLTTVNVQHLESLNDVVAKITGVRVRETVPDSVLDQADEIELVDLPPDELIQRLKEGKVYVPDLAREAVENYFRKGNLIALRELALVRTADRVDAQMRRYMRDHAVSTTWPVRERLMACVGAGPYSRRVVRAAKRLADSLRAEWIVAYVETAGHARLSEASRAQVAETLRLAEQLGAETVVLSGARIAEEILSHARTQNVSKLVIGKPSEPRWKRVLSGSIADTLVRSSEDIDVYVISGEEAPHVPYVAPPRPRTTDWWVYGLATLIITFCTALAWVMFPYFDLPNLIMLYLLGVVAVAARFGHGPSILASVLSVAAFDFFFVPPYFTFTVADRQHFITFGVMFVVALVISGLTVRIRWLADSARRRERQTAALYAMSRELADARGLDQIIRVSLRHIHEVFRVRAMALVPDSGGSLHPHPGTPPGGIPMDGNELAVAHWAYENGEMAGRGTTTLPGAGALYLPLRGSQQPVGVLGIRPVDPHLLETPERLRQLETFVDQMAIALERARLAEEAQQAQLRAEGERLRSSLLSSVSHDLRTPLATITGVASSLLEGGESLDAAARKDLLETLHEEADRLNRLVHNLLDMTRLESGALHVRKEWHPLEEVVGAALGRLSRSLRDRTVSTRLPQDLPLVPIDDVLIQQVLINLLDNAIKHTPNGSPIEIAAWPEPGGVTLEVADRGPGLVPGDEERVFAKFYRSPTARAHGSGLGLAICRGIAEAHGGRIWAENRAGGGVAFRFTLPLTGTPPKLEPVND